MFEETHRSLTRYYVSVTITLFTIVVISFLALMTWVIYSHEKTEAIAYSKETASEYKVILQKNLLSSTNIAKAVSDESVSAEGIKSAMRMFSIIRLPNGDTFPVTFITQGIQGWMLKQVSSNDMSQPRLMSYSTKGEKFRVFLVKEDIIENGQLYGTLYAGKDVTIIWNVVGKMLYFSLFLIIFFTFFLYRFGKKAAYRAMKPMELVLLKQKQFITDASHELKTPLSVMLTGTDVLQRDKKNILSEFSQQIVFDLQDEVKKMSNLVANLLQLSKLDEEKERERQITNVTQTALFIVNKFKPMAKQKNIQLLFEDIKPISKLINIDNVDQILSILIDNAIKYTQENGTVTVRLNIQDKKLAMIVEDNGIGISEIDQKYIFDRFYRADKARSRVEAEGSAGFGLAIVKTLVDNEKGIIKLESLLGKGTKFTVLLP